MAGINLALFCATPRMNREYFEQPFALGEHVYASSDHVCIRLDDGPALHQTEDARLKTVARWPWPKPDERRMQGDLSCDSSVQPTECEWCHDDPEGGCFNCRGLGTMGPAIRVTVDGNDLDVQLHYARLITALPDVRFVPHDTDKRIVRFVFCGGAGVLAALKDWHTIPIVGGIDASADQEATT